MGVILHGYPVRGTSQRQPKGCNNIPSFSQRTAPIALLFVKVAPGTTITTWSQHHFVAIGKPEQ